MNIRLGTEPGAPVVATTSKRPGRQAAQLAEVRRDWPDAHFTHDAPTPVAEVPSNA